MDINIAAAKARVASIDLKSLQAQQPGDFQKGLSCDSGGSTMNWRFSLEAYLAVRIVIGSFRTTFHPKNKPVPEAVVLLHSCSSCKEQNRNNINIVTRVQYK